MGNISENLPVRGRFMRFLSQLSCKFRFRFNEDEVEVIEADEEEGEDIVETVEEVEERCKSMGDGFSASSKPI